MITLQGSIDDGSTWVPVYPLDSAATAESYTNNANSIRPRVIQLPGGMWIRWTMGNLGGSPTGVFILIDGHGLQKAR